MTHWQAYPWRWVVLTTFFLSAAASAGVWISLAPIAHEAAIYYGTTTAAINWFSLAFMIVYTFSSFGALHFGDNLGIRKILIIGATCTTICVLLRAISTISSIHHTGTGYALALLGQFIGAIGQPIFANAPAAVAGAWFPRAERELGTTIAAMSTPLGNGIFSVLASVIVSEPSQVASWQIIEAVIVVVCTILLILTQRDGPPTPPSTAAAARAALRAAHTAQQRTHVPLLDDPVDMVTGLDEEDLSDEEVVQVIDRERADSIAMAGGGMLAEALHMLKDRNFLLLTLGYGIGLGFFNTYITITGQLILPCGYGSNIAGICAGVLLGCGILGAALTGPVMRAWGNYGAMLRIGIVMGNIGVVCALSANMPDRTGWLIASYGIMGFCIVPILPLVFEVASETTYPAPEQVCVTLMQCSGQVFGIIMTLVFPLMITTDCSTVVRPTNIAVLGSLIVALVSFFAFRIQYKRRAAEHAHDQTLALAPAGDKLAV